MCTPAEAGRGGREAGSRNGRIDRARALRRHTEWRRRRRRRRRQQMCRRDRRRCTPIYIYDRPTDENVFSADRKPNERNCHVPSGAMRHCHVSEKYDATANSENDVRRPTPARSSTSADVRQRGFFTTTRSVSVPYTGAYIRFETRSSAITEGPRDASCQLNSCQLPRNSTETTCTNDKS